ncbi:hypothetical protein GCM10009096_16290 [Parasphingorhabdus litoris]|uniref:Uncharacterized protein n=2 Tax=Parasphingorhabdus litoris TaxID=394733 RepID=A0ABN1AFR6_9SPHN
MIRTGLILLVTIVLSCLTTMNAIGGITKKKNPDIALSVWPKNGFGYQTSAINAFKAAIVENNGQFPDDIDEAIVTQAKKSFLSEPTAAGSVALLALNENQAKREKLMISAQKLSKRELVSQTWSIYDSAERQNVAQLLSYYDLSMRTSRTSSTALIPAIVSVIGQDGFAEPMVNLLKKNPPWAGQFWKQAANNKAAIIYASKLRSSLDESQIDRSQLHDRDLVVNLVRNNHFEEVEELYSQSLSDKEGARGITHVARLDRQPLYPPLDWQLFSTGKYFAFIDTENRILNLSSTAGSNGVMARQLLRINPGVYDLSLNIVADDLDIGSLRVSLTCAEPAAKNDAVFAASLKSGANINRLSISRDACRYFWLSIAVRADERVDGQDVAIDQIVLKPVKDSQL